MRKAFGVIFAVMILVMLSSLGIFMLEILAKNTKTLSDEHIKTQLKLYLDSSVEYALLWMSEDKNRSSNADYKDLNFLYDNYYKITLRIYHIKDYLPKETKGSVIIDVSGRYDNALNEPIVLTKRVVVKP